MGFDWKEFLTSTKTAFRCSTEEAEDFCKEMHEHGFKWCNGDSYLLSTERCVQEENTCYWSDCAYASLNDRKIVDWSDYMKNKGK